MLSGAEFNVNWQVFAVTGTVTGNPVRVSVGPMCAVSDKETPNIRD